MNKSKSEVRFNPFENDVDNLYEIEVIIDWDEGDYKLESIISGSVAEE